MASAPTATLAPTVTPRKAAVSAGPPTVAAPSAPRASAFIERHSALAYFAIAFAIAWGAILLIIGGPGSIPGTAEQTARLFPFVVLAYFAGPSGASLLLTGLVSGRAGYRE